MLTCSRCGLAVLVLLVLAFTGCDTNNPGGGGTLRALEGTYTLEELLFDPNTQALPDADVAGRFDLPATTLTIFGDDTEALLVSRRLGEGSRRTDLEVRALSNAIELTARTAEDAEDLERLFLPSTFRLSFSSSDARVLRASPDLFLDDINLQAFDPDLYQDQVSVRGRLAISFRRP